jgi:hypothetical protein
MARIDKEVFPFVIIKIPEEQFPDAITIVFEGFDTGGQLSKNKQLAVDSIRYTAEAAGVTRPFEGTDPSRVGKVSIGSEGINTQLRVPKFYRQSAFKDNIKIGGENFKIAKIDTPFTDIDTVNAWAHRDNWEDDTQIDIEMFASSDLKAPGVSGRSWTKIMTLKKYKSLPIDYSIEYLLNGNIYGKAGKLAQAVIPLVQSMIMFLTEDLQPNIPTAKQIAMKLLGPASPYIQQKMAWVEDMLSQTNRVLDQIRRMGNMLEDCKVIDSAPEIPTLKIPGIPTPNFGVRDKVILLIKEWSPNLDLHEEEIKKLIDNVDMGISPTCMDHLSELLGIIYEVVPREGISNVIYEFGE